MQEENELDQMDWIEKITGVITSLLSSQGPDRVIILRLCMTIYVYIYVTIYPHRIFSDVCFVFISVPNC